MALSINNRGTGTHNTSATSFTLSPGSNFAAGDTAVLCVAADNSSAGGSTNNFTTVTDSLGNTWTKRQSPVFDNGAANAGVQGAIYDCEQDVGTLQTSTVITVNFGAATVAKTWTLTGVTPAAGKKAVFRTGGDKAAGATGTALTSGASVTVNVGEVIVAAFFIEAGTTQTLSAADTDTTNGTWTTNQYAEIGSTTSGSVIVSQAKLQTTTNSTQTYDVTLGISSDYHGSYAIYQEITSYTLSCAAGSFTHTGQAATLLYGRAVAAAAGSYSLAGQVAALLVGYKLTAAAGSYAWTGQNATLTHGTGSTYTLTAAAGSFALTGQAASLEYGREIAAATGAYTLSGQSLSFLRGYVLSANAGAYVWSGAAASLQYSGGEEPHSIGSHHIIDMCVGPLMGAGFGFKIGRK